MFAGRRKFWILGAVAFVALVVVGAGTGMAVANGGDDSSPITGDAYDQASAAALAFTGGGTVTETEVGDEESLYQVEVTLDDGSQVDVNLDKDFKVVTSKHEAGETNDDGPNGDNSDED